MDRSAVRRKQIEIARRRGSRGAGSDLTFLMALARRALPMDLHTLFGDIPYAVVGGIATRSYMPERMTKDVDILVPSEHFAPAQERLAAAGWAQGQALAFFGSVLALKGQAWHNDGEELDLMTADTDWAEEAIASAAPDASKTRTVGLPYLVLMKLDAGRTQDTSDIARMLGLAEEATLALTRSVTRRFMPDAHILEDLESLIEIGRWEIGSA